MLRFHHALDRLRAGEPSADIAYDCGYYDQPHLNREFREFAGVTPGELAAAISPGGLGVVA